MAVSRTKRELKATNTRQPRFVVSNAPIPVAKEHDDHGWWRFKSGGCNWTSPARFTRAHGCAGSLAWSGLCDGRNALACARPAAYQIDAVLPAYAIQAWIPQARDAIP